jgi:hypothetical protein
MSIYFFLFSNALNHYYDADVVEMFIHIKDNIDRHLGLD